MAYIRIILLTAILVAFTCVGFFSFAQKVQDVKVGSQAVSDLPLFLNGEAVGTIGNTKALESRLGSLPGGLKSNVNGADGLPNIGKMVFVADEQLSMAGLGELWDKIDDYFDYPHYEKMALWAGESCDADRNPSAGAGASVLVLSNMRLSSEELKKFRRSEGCWIRAEFTLLKSPSAYSTRVLKSYRTAVTSFEVTESGAYLINEQVQNPKLRASPIANLGHPALRRAVDAAPIKPRSVDPALLDKEIDAWIKLRESEGPIGMSAEEDPSVDLPLIISGKISYAALVPILKRLKKQRNRLSIVVNDLQPNTSARPN